MHFFIYKSIAAFLIFACSLMISVYFIKRKQGPHHDDSFLLGEALASGIFLGAAFFHMLPDAIRDFSKINDLTYPIPEAICVGGFLLMLFLERLTLVKKSTATIPYLLTLILIIHALTEGAALGIGKTYSEIVMLFIAILAHKGSETFALWLTLLRHKLPVKQILMISLFFSFMTPIGILLGSSIDLLTNDYHALLASGIFNAFAAGTFIYISTLHHVRFHKHDGEAQGYVEFISLVMGICMMGVIAIWT